MKLINKTKKELVEIITEIEKYIIDIREETQKDIDNHITKLGKMVLSGLSDEDEVEFECLRTLTTEIITEMKLLDNIKYMIRGENQ